MWTPKSRIFVEDSSESSGRPWVSGLQDSKKVSSSLQEVGIFSYSGYSSLRVIQWPCGSTLAVGLV